jgi:two-component system response regulator HydG
LAGSELFGHIKGSFTGAINDKEGQFESAQGGTLFLDEIGNLSYEIQMKLLRALQERKVRRIGSNKDIDVDVRILVATNEDLAVSVNKGDFREDLYHRLNEFKITVPSLRNRIEDIEIFSNYFLELSNNELNKDISGFSSEVLDKFRTYSWPGNLRELRNIIRRSVLLSPDSKVELVSLPNEILNNNASNNIIVEGSNLKLIQAANEKELIVSTLKRVNYNKSKAARLLNIDRKTLYNKLKQYEIDI